MGAEQGQIGRNDLVQPLGGLFVDSVLLADKCMEGYRRDLNGQDVEYLRGVMVSAANNVKLLEKKLDREQYEDLRRNVDDVSKALDKYLSRGDLLSDVAVSQLLFVTNYTAIVLSLLEEGHDYTDECLDVVPFAEQEAEKGFIELKEKLHELRRARKYEKMRLSILYS